MPMHSNVRSRLVGRCVAAVLGLSATAAGSQLLDFGTGAPEPGTGQAALALAATLTDQANDIADGRHAGEISSAAAARIAVRRLASAMLTQGEYAGANGSDRIVAARRIARRLHRIDAFLETADAHTPEIVRAQAMHAAADIPVLGPGLDRMLRNVFAACTRSASTMPDQIAWTPETPADQPRLDAELARWEREESLSPAAIQALRALESRLIELERWPAYRRSIDAVRAQVREAGLCLALDRRWLGDEAADALIARFESALALAADPGATDAARAQLRTVALLAVLVPAVESFTSGLSARAARDSL
ncbi:MAG: hypothetical protein IID31_09360, partial [Planctomycetes bacterium]|nr:hypothetical protein [Planctomycetota bacterium]